MALPRMGRYTRLVHTKRSVSPTRKHTYICHDHGARHS
jgi:hypothetical protein